MTYILGEIGGYKLADLKAREDIKNIKNNIKTVPTEEYDLVNKKYVDDNMGIPRLIGTVETPIKLFELDYGTYLVKGNYTIANSINPEFLEFTQYTMPALNDVFIAYTLINISDHTSAETATPFIIKNPAKCINIAATKTDFVMSPLDATMVDFISMCVDKELIENQINTIMDSLPTITFWTGTQSEYDAIASKNDTTLYIIKEG